MNGPDQFRPRDNLKRFVSPPEPLAPRLLRLQAQKILQDSFIAAAFLLFAIPVFFCGSEGAGVFVEANRQDIFGRGARIRTGGLLRPRQARYQAALRPDSDCFIHSKALSNFAPNPYHRSYARASNLPAFTRSGSCSIRGRLSISQ